MSRRKRSTIIAFIWVVSCVFYMIKYFSGEIIYVKQIDLNIERPDDGDVSTLHSAMTSHCSRDDFTPSTVSLYDLRKQPNNIYDCPNIKVFGKTVWPKICLYPSEHDAYAPKIIKEEGVYEFVDFFVDKLRKNPDMSVIDVGANIGMYTLVAAWMGRQVVAVEAMPPHVSRLHASVVINNFHSKVTLLHNAISDCKGKVITSEARHNEGDLISTYSIMLSDIIPFVNFTRAYMKIGIEGFEHKALVRLPDLLRRVDIPIIQMEWKQLQLYYSLDKFSEDLILTEQFVHQLVFLGYAPYDRDGYKLDITSRASWTIDPMLWMTEKAP